MEKTSFEGQEMNTAVKYALEENKMLIQQIIDQRRKGFTRENIYNDLIEIARKRGYNPSDVIRKKKGPNEKRSIFKFLWDRGEMIIKIEIFKK